MSSTWDSDWKSRIGSALAARGFHSIVDFARANESATFYEMAAALGDGVPPVQIEVALREDSREHGCFDYFLRSALVRQLHHYVPNGIRMHGEWKLIRALSSWVGMVGTTRDLEGTCSLAADRIQKDASLADDWLPPNADDPLLVQRLEVQ